MTENELIVSLNSNDSQVMNSNLSFRKPSSPLQSMSRSRITLRPNISDSLKSSQQIHSSLNRLSETSFSFISNSSLSTSSASIETPINEVMAQKSPSTGYSSLSNLWPSIDNKIERNTIEPKVYNFGSYNYFSKY